MSSKQTRYSVVNDGEKKKLRFLIIAPTPFFVSRGTPIRILEEARALERRGHSITLVSYHIGEDLPAETRLTIDHRRIRRLLFWYKKIEAGANWQKIVLDVMLFRKVFSLARKQKPDVLYAHLHEGALIGWAVQKILFWRNMTLVCDFHGGLTSEMVSHGYLGNTILAWVFRVVERWINGFGDVAVSSSWENTKVINTHRPKSRRAETLLDGAAIQATCLRKKEERVKNDRFARHFRTRFNLPEKEFVFAYTGALIPNKGLDVLLESIQFFFASGHRAHFVLAGFPVGNLREWVMEQGFEKYVTIISPLHWFSLSELLVAIDAGIDPKNSETHQASGKILQYMGAGLPVVCFSGRENNWRFLGEGGVYATDVSASALSDAFVWCVNNVDAARKKGHENCDRARRFSWDAGAETVEAFILGKRKGCAKNETGAQ